MEVSKRQVSFMKPTFFFLPQFMSFSVAKAASNFHFCIAGLLVLQEIEAGQRSCGGDFETSRIGGEGAVQMVV